MTLKGILGLSVAITAAVGLGTYIVTMGGGNLTASRASSELASGSATWLDRLPDGSAILLHWSEGPAGDLQGYYRALGPNIAGTWIANYRTLRGHMSGTHLTLDVSPSTAGGDVEVFATGATNASQLFLVWSDGGKEYFGLVPNGDEWYRLATLHHALGNS